jgi:lipopolysaccharide/colanic/teichoic acid biosynthesis glycosyltransferase
MLIARAPVRISLAGGGTDLKAYCAEHSGMVVSATIDKYFYVFLTPNHRGSLPAGTLTVPGDPRITRVGRWLRRLSLDELPQLFNVLRGEMSLVGPRMLAPEEHAALTAFPEWQRTVLAVKPGMTGPWQVSGRRLLPYEERVRLDLEYVRGATLWTDLLVLLRTLPAVLGGRGAF